MFSTSSYFVKSALSLHARRQIYMFIDYILLSFGCQVTLPMKSFNALPVKDIEQE